MMLRLEDRVLLALCGGCLLVLGRWYFSREVDGGRKPGFGILIGMTGVAFGVLALVGK